MKREGRHQLVLVAAFLAISSIVTGCGGGAAGTSSSTQQTPPQTPPQAPPAAVALEWAPPTSFIDNTPLNPASDLDHYEIFVSESASFTDNDVPVAAVAAVTTTQAPDGSIISRIPTSRFILTNILPFLEQGRSYYVSVRAVGTDNLVSSFSTPVEWDLG
jgi:hypothetical protein